MDMQHGHAAWTCGMEMQHGHVAWMCSAEKLHVHSVYLSMLHVHALQKHKNMFRS